MSAGTWTIIAYAGFALAAVGLVTTVVLFFRLNILSVIGDLSGRTVAREIQAIREANAASGEKIHRSSRVNVDRGPLTDVVDQGRSGGKAAMGHLSKRLDSTTGGLATEEGEEEQKRKRNPLRFEPKKEPRKKFASQSETPPTDVLKAEKTDVLKTNETEVLKEEPTDVLNKTAAEVANQGTDVLQTGTEVLREEAGETAVLTRDEDLRQEDAEKTTTLAEQDFASGQTDLLYENSADGATDRLDGGATDLLTAEESGTTLLDSAPGEGTTILKGTTEELDKKQVSKPITILRKMDAIHTDETI